MVMMLAAAASLAQAPTATTQGRDFWLTFMPQNDGPGERSLVVAGEEGATVTVAASNGWQNIQTIGPEGVLACSVPDTQGIVFHVTSTADISVYASNYREFSYDIATVYPTQSLGWYYIVQTYDLQQAYNGNPQVAVVATEDDTRVLVTPRGGTMRETYLDAGEAAYFYWQDTYEYPHSGGFHMDGTMTGTRIYGQAGKPLAVFQGSQCTFVRHSACDHLFEQAVPVSYWGRQFLVVPIAERVADDVVRIVSSMDNCHVSFNDTTFVVINAGYYFDTVIRTATSIGATAPVSVCMYMSAELRDSVEDGGLLGDPSAIIIPPVDQGVTSTNFAAINTAISTHHYANVVTQTCHVNGVTLDGVAVDSAFTAYDDRWSYAQLQVSPGAHTLASNSGTLNAWFYGMGYAESYGYIAGMTLENHAAQLFVDGMEVTSTVYQCMGDTAHVELVADPSVAATRWTLNGAVLPTGRLHCELPLDSVGTYTLRAMLPGDCCREWCDSLEVILQVNPTYAVVEEDSICEGVPYEWHSIAPTEAGSYDDTLRTRMGCDSVTTLRLFARPFPKPGVVVEADCQSHMYTLTAIRRDTLQWTDMQWATTPPDNTLMGHEGDATITISPSMPTFVTLHAEAVCAADTTMLLRPIVIPTAQMEVRPKTIAATSNASFDAYDMSLDATGREWVVDGVATGVVGRQLHWPVSGAEDSIEVVLMAVNDYCRDTTREVVWVMNEGIYAPNVITPNRDINNRFTIFSSNEIDGELTIYNREGLPIYTTSDFEVGWGGEGSPQGAYVWHLRYRYLHTPERWYTAVGTVTLLK